MNSTVPIEFQPLTEATEAAAIQAENERLKLAINRAICELEPQTRNPIPSVYVLRNIWNDLRRAG